MKILFYHPSSHSDGYPEPPIGLGYLMSIAKKAGYEYEFFDEDHHSKILSLETMVQQYKPDLYAISFMTPQIYMAKKIISRFKEWTPDARVVVGGPHPSALPEETMQEIQDIDFLCKGEGEKTFEAFLDYVDGRMSLEEVDGLYFRKAGMITANKPRDLISKSELDNYSVDWEKIMEHGPYMQKLVYMKTIEPALAVITTRGCPFHCTFCDEGNIWKKQVRMRSLDNVIDEIRYLHRTYNVRHFNILDDTFTLSKSRVLEFCRRIKPLNINFRITAKTTTINKEVLEKLKQAGCQIIAFGVESGDEKVLKTIKKGQTIADIEKAFALCRSTGISSYALCMVGNIGEDMNAVKKTSALLKRIKPDLFSSSLMTPYPGSENYRICKENGWILHHDWEYWVPSVLKMKGFKPVSRTDKMDEKALMKAYYFMNRHVLINRFYRKYGRLFLLHVSFYMKEVFPRLKRIGMKSFLNHVIGIFIQRKNIGSGMYSEG